jgi:3-dehydroquinate dehydratase
MHDTAAHLGITISCRESNHEGEILDLLLNADPATSILLSLNGTVCSVILSP